MRWRSRMLACGPVRRLGLLAALWLLSSDAFAQAAPAAAQPPPPGSYVRSSPEQREVPAVSEGGSCGDGKRNGRESDVDCGGDCNPCWHGSVCAAPRDCASGRCVLGKCAERPWEEGDEVPRGYRVEASSGGPGVTARIAGTWFFGISYAAAYATALAAPQDAGAMFVPVAGPWLVLGDVEDRGAKAALVIDGVLQGAGALLILGGIASTDRQLLREPEARTSPRLRVTASAVPGSYRLGLSGAF